MTYPTDPEFQSINFRSNNFVTTSESINGKIKARSIGAQRWEFTASYDRLTKAEIGIISAYIISQGGSFGEFTVVPTEISSTRGTATGVVEADGAHTAGDKTIAVTGLGASETLLKGDLVKFADHNKVYMVTEDLTGDGTLTIYPALVENVADNEDLTYNNVPFTVRLANDIQSYEVNANNQYNVEVDFIESL